MDTIFYAAIGVFLITYILIISEKVHRSVIAGVGAVLMILLGILTQEEAIEGVDFNTIGLLVGMMIIVGIAKNSGLFQAVAIWAAQRGKGDPVRIFLFLGIITALFSAFLDNVTTVLLIVPVIFVIAHNLRINPIPYLFGTIIFSNVGGAATLIGDPPNILIGSAAGLSFNDFLFNLGPVIVLLLVVTGGMFFFKYRNDLCCTDEAKEKIMRFRAQEAITDVPLLRRSLAVIALVVVGFFTHSVTHLEGATIALAGAGLLLLLTLHEPDEYLRDIEWTTIFFFMGLFVLVAGLEQVGAVRMLAEWFLRVTGGNPFSTGMAILWGSAVLSAIVDNIPFVATMIPLVKEIGVLTGMATAPLWWALALGADIGGNFTIVGASANVVVKGMAEKDGYQIGFWDYMKTAVPVTVISLIVITAYIAVRYF